MIDKSRVRRVGVAALLASGLLTVNTSASAANGERVVVPGERIIVNANGFQPGATVTLQLIPHPASQSAIPNPGGHVQFLYVVPKTLTIGEYQLAIVGPAKDAAQGESAGAATTATLNPQTITVVVPRLVFVPFRIGGHGVASVPPVQRGDPDALADTGVPVEQQLAIALSLILAGFAIVIAARRRRRAELRR